MRFSGSTASQVSVIVSTRNRAASLQIALDRIFAQRFNGAYDYEVVVVNNASTDDTEQVIKNHPAMSTGRLCYVFAAQP